MIPEKNTIWGRASQTAGREVLPIEPWSISPNCCKFPLFNYVIHKTAKTPSASSPKDIFYGRGSQPFLLLVSLCQVRAFLVPPKKFWDIYCSIRDIWAALWPKDLRTRWCSISYPLGVRVPPVGNPIESMGSCPLFLDRRSSQTPLQRCSEKVFEGNIDAKNCEQLSLERANRRTDCNLRRIYRRTRRERP